MADRWTLIPSVGDAVLLNASFHAEQYEVGGVDEGALRLRDDEFSVQRVGDALRTPAPFVLRGRVWVDDQDYGAARVELNDINAAAIEVDSVTRATSAGVFTYAGLNRGAQVEVVEDGAGLFAVTIVVWPSSSGVSFAPTNPDPGNGDTIAILYATTGFAGGRLRKINEDGTIAWDVQIGDFAGAPSVGHEGDAYVGFWVDGTGWRVGRFAGATGAEVWAVTAGAFTFTHFGTIDNDGHPIWTLNDAFPAEVKRYHKDTGVVLASGDTNAEYSWRSGVAPDGRVYFGGRDPNVARVNGDLGSAAAIVSGDDYAELYGGFTVSPGGKLFVAGEGVAGDTVTFGAVVERLDASGVVLWSAFVNTDTGPRSRWVEAGQEARVYASLVDTLAGNTKTHAFDAVTGVELWSWLHPNYVDWWSGSIADAVSVLFVSDFVHIHKLHPVTGALVTGGGWPVAMNDAQYLAVGVLEVP